jgi:superfamily II DNA or RNA helicase
LRCYENEKGKIYSCEQIRKSWDNKVNYETENRSKNIKGLRQAQLGAVFAIRAHWIVSKEAATVVMPTGTGKTETMITTIVAEQCRRVFILVPSDLLRVQTVENCVKFGILKDIGVIDQRAKYPNVLCLKSQPKTKDELKEILDSANIIVSTAKLVSRFDIEYMNMLSSKCDVLIVDEAHHIEANRWNQIKSFFREKKILQFTATPFRNDGKKLDGDIIFNFPLSMAQEQGYFQKINFKPIIEYDEEKGDYAIAQAAVRQLKSDLENGFNHIILVRTKGVQRAKQLFENIYAHYFAQYNPVLIISEMTVLEKKSNMEALKTGKSQIVVCVDMFGEGIDIPNLKIAAIHDRYKLLPITLQFIGRFARSKVGLGDATIITNLANEDIQDALAELYSQDSDWNSLLSELSEGVIGKEITLQKLANGFKGSGIESINIKQLRPALSMMAVKTETEEWHWENWTQLFDEGLCKYYINEEENIFIVIEPEESKIDWANYREINNLNWNLHIAYWNKEKEVVFLN